MQRLWKALFYSLAGLRDAWRHPACRLEIVAIVLAVPIAIVLPIALYGKLMLIASNVAIFVVELLNTSIESAIDRIGVERHELSRIAKDIGSAAVFTTALLSLVLWIVLAGPSVVNWIFTAG
ncbi:MAG TPA: diacylglycerol kinase [Casimicrobiaceae bacterium]|nr:diacylglycerol kinase [Casimicrobiaceae bacterium]